MDVNTHARKTDPLSSHLASLDNSNRRQDQIETVVSMVKRNPGRTSMEMASSGHCRYMVARRLSDAVIKGLVVKGPQRTCTISNRLSLTWLPKLDD